MPYIEPIAYIHTDFKEKFGIPRQSGRVSSVIGKIVFCPKFRDPEALREIMSFSHLWLLFDFSKAHTDNWSPTVRPPRLGGNKKVGVFASRSPFRPNNIGLSSVKLERIERTKNEGDVLYVSGADLLDMTPIYDIKPYIPYSDCHTDAVGGYADENSSHRLSVEFDNALLCKIEESKQQAVIDCIAEDPRPSYIECDRIYGMKFDKYNIRFTVSRNKATVISVETKTEQ